MTNIFKVSILPSEVVKLLKNLEANLIHNEFHVFGQQEIAILVYEKCFNKKNSNIASLTIIIDNKLGNTYIRYICSGTSSFFGINWEVGAIFEDLIKSCIDKYII